MLRNKHGSETEQHVFRTGTLRAVENLSFQHRSRGRGILCCLLRGLLIVGWGIHTTYMSASPHCTAMARIHLSFWGLLWRLCAEQLSCFVISKHQPTVHERAQPTRCTHLKITQSKWFKTTANRQQEHHARRVAKHLLLKENNQPTSLPSTYGQFRRTLCVLPGGKSSRRSPSSSSITIPGLTSRTIFSASCRNAHHNEDNRLNHTNDFRGKGGRPEQRLGDTSFGRYASTGH